MGSFKIGSRILLGDNLVHQVDGLPLLTMDGLVTPHPLAGDGVPFPLDDNLVGNLAVLPPFGADTAGVFHKLTPFSVDQYK